MNELIKAIEKLAQEELERANKQYPLFSSRHEGCSVLREEVEETADEVEDMLQHIGDMWEKIKADDYEIADLEIIRQSAIYAAAEAIQSAAMCEKYKLSAQKEDEQCEQK